MNDKLKDEINRGARAESLLSEGLIIEATAHIEAEIFRLFKEAAPTDTEALTQIKAMQYMHQKYLAYFKRCIQDGKLAKLEIERKPRHTASEFGYR